MGRDEIEFDEATKLTLMQTLILYLTNTSPLYLMVHLVYIGFVCIVLSMSYVVAFHWASVIEIYRQAHEIKDFSTNFKTNTEADNQINNKLESFLDDNGGMRVYVYRYHNGLAAISGVPFFFQSNTHEIIAPGASRLMPYEQRIPASIHIAMNNEFVQDKCMIIPDTTVDKTSQNYYFYTSRNAKAMARCPIFTPNGDLFGFVGIDWNHTISGTDGIETKLHDLAKQLGNIFENTVNKIAR